MWMEILKDIVVSIVSGVILEEISSKREKWLETLKKKPYETFVVACLIAIAVGIWTIVMMHV